MKKVLLSAFVIISFAIYSLIEQSKIVPNLLVDDFTPDVSPTPSIVLPTPTAGPVATAPPPTKTNSPTSASPYKDGQYIGDVVDAFYGNVQVKAIISRGKITDVKFLQAPNDRGYSLEVTAFSTPLLTSEAITAQSAKVDIVSGATATSEAFIQSLQSALNQAKS